MAKTTLTTRQRAARQAVRTRQARDAFFAEHPEAYQVAQLVAQGMTSEEIADETWLTVPQVRAYRANISRNAYEPTLSLCRF